MFKDMIQHTIEQQISQQVMGHVQRHDTTNHKTTNQPTKLCKIKDNIPYMTAEISRLIKRRDRAIQKCHKAQNNFE